MMNFVVNNRVDWILINSVNQFGTDEIRIHDLIRDIYDYSTRVFVVEDETIGMDVILDDNISSF